MVSYKGVPIFFDEEMDPMNKLHERVVRGLVNRCDFSIRVNMPDSTARTVLYVGASLDHAITSIGQSYPEWTSLVITVTNRGEHDAVNPEANDKGL